jgi:1-acyl-sn-glycerol-3-phosphate acyltransferase
MIDVVDNVAPVQPCYRIAHGIVGVPTLGQYVRTLAGGAWWFGVPPLFARMLARAGRRAALHRAEHWWARGVRRHLRIALDIEGLEHIEPGRSYVVAPLHEGFADAIALLHLPLPMRFVARDELFGWRFLGPYLRDTGQIYVAPERPRWSYRQLLRHAPSLAAGGESVVLFPQGTILGIETDFRSGAFALARALGWPVLPVALTGSHRVWEHPYTPLLRYDQRVSVRVLPPVTVEGRRDDVEGARVAVRRQLKAAALDGDMALPRRFVPKRDGYWDGYNYQIDPDFAELAAHIAQHRRSITE